MESIMLGEIAYHAFRLSYRILPLAGDFSGGLQIADIVTLGWMPGDNAANVLSKRHRHVDYFY